MEVNCFLISIIAFVSGCVFMAILIGLCNRSPSKRNNSIPKLVPSRIEIPSSQMDFTPQIPMMEELRANKFTNELWLFPDQPKLPCWNYNNKLMRQQANSCARNCDRTRYDHYLHTNDQPGNLIKLNEKLASARSTIDICVFLFTLKETAKLLVRLKETSGILVRVICDPGRSEESNRGNDQIPYLLEKGIQVKEPKYSNERFRPLMHHKYAVIDGSDCFLGSFNWTGQAAKHNYESIIRTNDPVCVNQLMAEFEKLWRTLPLARPDPVNN